MVLIIFICPRFTCFNYYIIYIYGFLFNIFFFPESSVMLIKIWKKRLFYSSMMKMLILNSILSFNNWTETKDIYKKNVLLLLQSKICLNNNVNKYAVDTFSSDTFSDYLFWIVGVFALLLIASSYFIKKYLDFKKNKVIMLIFLFDYEG